ncbi:MAG TPA: hypothetical protein VMW27_07320 [Thermoanaerobaculia bacterium]|nr:hypothetical protein [Thermoanaerobaculia bacterium]
MPGILSMGRIGLVLMLSLLCAPALSAQVTRGGGLPSPLPLFPPDNWWNVDISAAPLDPNSANFINFIGGDVLHPDFGGDVDPDDPSNPETYGMIFYTVPGNQPLEPVTWVEYGNQSDNGAPGRPAGYPIPVEARTGTRWIEGGWPANQPGGGYPDFELGDRHMLIIDRDNRILYELYHTYWDTAQNRWEAGSGAVFYLDSNQRRPETWTSADAAGLAIFPGLIRYDEAFGTDPIRHAFRFTVRVTRGYVFPASHDATTSSNVNALPLGARLRLKASKDISGYPAYIQRIFQAMKTYGLIVADNGTDMFIQGTHDTRWNNDVLNPAFDDLTASDFEVVQLGWQPPVSTSTGALSFHTVSPCRVLDTRNASGAQGGPALPAGGQRVFVVHGRCGIPATAKAISANVTVVNAPGIGHLTLFPGNASPPTSSTINFRPGLTRANNAILMLASSGTGTLTIQNNATAGATHVLIDVNGYFQ